MNDHNRFLFLNCINEIVKNVDTKGLQEIAMNALKNKGMGGLERLRRTWLELVGPY